jgi:hypothetical protein
MREIYKTYSQKGKKQMKTTYISVALLVAATMILSSVPAMSFQTNTTTLNVNIEEEVISNGLAPRTKVNAVPTDSNYAEVAQSPIGPLGEIMYGYDAYPGPEKTIWFDVDEPGTLNEIAPTQSGDFIAGGTYGCDEVWYGTQYGNGLLWKIDPYTGDMESVGGGGTGMNGLAYDPVTNKMYGSSDSNYLYEIDPDTGEQTQIGPFGSGVVYMIGMAFDIEGTLYGWDLGQDSLWTIDVESGAATKVGSLGISINFAQDGDFHRDSDILYLTAYVSTGQLYTCDKATGQCELVGTLGGGVEVTGSCFLNTCEPPEHDISVRSIDSPSTGRAEPDMDMLMTVKNTGNNTETFDAQMEIIKCEAGPLIYEEYFDDGVLPENWSTDYWKIYNSNVAGGVAPEARCYRYDYGGQTYDNYIMSSSVDCTGLEKVNLRFRWAGDYYYPQYAAVYVKFRRNSTSPWKDVTPWNNPVGSNQDGELWEIGCYGFGEPMGDEFQMQWTYIGYYYYFNYLWLDDVTLEACGGCAEYAELVEDITLDKGEEIQVSFPGWTPSEWQNESSENTWEEYPIHGFIICEGDLNPRNDYKWKLIDLWYPWMHDVEVMSIDSPHEEGRSMPGQTFPVQATMRNVGQYPECCIPIDISIGNSLVEGTPLYETEWDYTGWPYYYLYGPGYGSGWRDEHKVFAYYYGWRYTTGSQAGGEPPEAYLYYYYARQDYVFYSAALDTSAYNGMSMELKFLTYMYAWGNFGLYEFQAGYSYDLVTWYAAWAYEPSGQERMEVEAPILCEGDTMYIGFWFKGLNSGWYYWYIDNVELVAKSFHPEFEDFACQGPDINPGEAITFDFDDWTPDFLAEETTGQREYIVECFIEMERDKNPGNDILIEKFILDFWHDVGIEKVTSPNKGKNREVLWDNFGINSASVALASQLAENYPFNAQVADDFIVEQNAQLTTITFWGGFWNGAPVNPMDVNIILYEDDGGKPTGSGMSNPEDTALAYWTIEDVEGEMEFTNYYKYVAELDEAYPLEAGVHYWIVAQAYLTFPPQWGFASNDGDDQLETSKQGFPVLGLPFWSEHGYGDVAFMLEGTFGGAPAINCYIQPGNQDITAIVKNYGTFPKSDLTCYAQIWEFITDPENGTELYTDQIDNIDLPTPLGGEKNLQFTDFTFADEGRYGLFLQFPADPDDVQKNNKKSWGVGVDDTRPVSDPQIVDPEDPDGLNGWYVSDVTVTLNASDPVSHDVSSGVKEIRYTINGGAEQVLPGSTGSFILTDDGEDILIEYWAVDEVGNVESPTNTFTVSIDQTVPNVKLEYEIIGGSSMTGWDFLFTATATDDMSGMDYVEFDLNDVLQETVTGPGPTYTWEMKYYGGLKIEIKAEAFDKAGLHIFDTVEPEHINAHSTPREPQQQSTELPQGRPLVR